MSLDKGAFNADAYHEQYGPALNQIAGFSAVSGAGGVDATDSDTGQSTLGGYDQDQEQNIAKQNATNTSAAPMQSPFQTQRQMNSLPPPAPSKLDKGSGGPSPASSGAFYDANGPQQSAPVYHAVDQLTDDQAKAHARDIDEKVGAGKDQHGIPDLQTLWKHTYEDELSSKASDLQLSKDAADKAANPTWRDKLSMMLDATNRASAIRAQNPAMSKGDIWAVATRGAMDGWMAHAQGAHDAYSKQQTAFQTQAHKDADETVKRASDQFGLQQKADVLMQNQAKIDETSRHNKADEANNAIKDKATAAREGAAAKKGDLVTLDADAMVDGKMLPKGSMVSVDAQGKPHATGISGTKAGTKAPGAGEDEKATKDAQGALDKITASIDKQDMEDRKNAMSPRFGKDPLSDDDKTARAKEMLRQRNPKAYKSLYGETGMADVAPKPAGAGGNPSWYKPQK